MIRQEDILKALQEGADASALAQQFADALNAAIAQQNQNQAVANQKREKMQAIIDAVFAFIAEYYPEFDLPEEMKNEITADVIIAAFDDAKEEAAHLFKFFAATPSVRPVKGNSIENFLQANGLGNLRR
jgi:hypothetical protein